jgi:hypothetical protein
MRDLKLAFFIASTLVAFNTQADSSLLESTSNPPPAMVQSPKQGGLFTAKGCFIRAFDWMNKSRNDARAWHLGCPTRYYMQKARAYGEVQYITCCEAGK